jgi:hypothetical protein
LSVSLCFLDSFRRRKRVNHFVPPSEHENKSEIALLAELLKKGLLELISQKGSDTHAREGAGAEVVLAPFKYLAPAPS